MPSSAEAEHTSLFILLLGWDRNTATNKNKKEKRIAVTVLSLRTDSLMGRDESH